jgi:hypothetical protein
VLCLPVAGISKLVLEVSALALCLGLLALLGGAAYLWFRPAELPAQVQDTLNGFPRLAEYLPEPASPCYGTCVTKMRHRDAAPSREARKHAAQPPRHRSEG